MTGADRATDRVFAGGGEMRTRCRALDWAATPLGAVAAWPASLRAAASAALGSGFPCILLWGPELVQLYNDSYVPIIGAKHPMALGCATRECWPEVWHINGPVYDRVRTGETVTLRDALYPLQRRGPDVPPDDVYLTLSYGPVRDEAGDVGGVLITMFDTTEQVKARVLEQDHARLRRELEVERTRLVEVFRQAPSFLAVLSGAEHVFTQANDAYYQIVGQGRDIIGKSLFDALPETRGQGFDGYMDRVLESGEPLVFRELPVKLDVAAGAPHEDRFIDITYLPLVDADGTRSAVIAHGVDVTDHVRARRDVERLLGEARETQTALEDANAQLEEQQLELELSNQQLQDSAAELETQAASLDQALAETRASDRRLRDIFDQAPVAVAVMTGPDHVYTLVSPRYARSPGGGRQLLGRSMRQAFPELEGQPFYGILDRVYETGEPYFASERMVPLDLDGDGVAEEHYFNVGYQPLRDAAEKVYAIASVAYDVTTQVIARREVDAARAEAEQANQAKSEFLTTMSHELRTPLNAVLGYAQLLQLGVRGALSDPQREDVDRIRRSGQHLLGLINDVLNFAKLEAGQVEIRAEPIALAPLLSDVVDLIAPQLEAKGVRYEVVQCDPMPTPRGDTEKVRQILLNLLVNAVKFTESGGRVTLSCDDGDGRVRIHVRDTGRGIASEQLPRIFDPFVQVDRHLTPSSQQGVGLGLSISRDLARAMGGELRVESVEGEGSVFTLELPGA